MTSTLGEASCDVWHGVRFGSLAERVTRGVELLDERGFRDWRDRIDLEGLDVYDPFRCVLGQVYDSFGLGVAMLDLAQPARAYGFDCEPFERVALNAEWRRVLGAEDSR